MLRSSISLLRSPFGLLFLAAVAFLVPTFSHAQIAPDPHLTVSPAYPKPYSTATVSLETSGVSVSGGTIRWFVNGTEAVGSANARSLSIQIDEMGRAIRVEARFSSEGGTPYALSIPITPTTIDIVAEPQTYTPSFYGGRALPTAGSSVRLVAMAHLSEGATSPATTLYTWRVNGVTLFGGPRLGQNFATVDMPLSGSMNVTVRAETRDGSRAAESTATLRPSSPIVAIYEDDPLYGTIPLSFPQSFSSRGEVTLRAEPFFFGESDLASSRTSYMWSIDGRDITNPSSEPNVITLRQSGEASSASVGLSLRKTEGVLQLARTSLVLEFIGSNIILP